jgi:uncharacterized metal-binding protein YceD (DUF177 family)
MPVITPDSPLTEFSRLVAVDRLAARGTHCRIVAEPAELLALAQRLDLREVRSLTATAILVPLPKKGSLVRVSGSFTAEVVQTCVVSLEPLDATVSADFERTYGPGDVTLEEGGEVELSWDSEDPPDPIIDGSVDIGEAVVEELSLALDPFPRAGDITFELPAEPEDDTEKVATPFAVLAALRQKKE